MLVLLVMSLTSKEEADCDNDEESWRILAAAAFAAEKDIVLTPATGNFGTEETRNAVANNGIIVFFLR